MTNRPETLSPLRHQIVAAMAEAAMGGIRQRERVSDLVSLGAVFTPDDIRDVGPQLIPALAIAAGTARPTYPAPISSVVERLGDAGPTAVPLLEKLLFDRENGQAAAIALCRIGAPAASAVDALEALAASEPIADNYFPGRATAATLALARLGRGDLALSHVPPPSAMQHGSLFHFDHFRGLRDRVVAMSSSSPPWFCSYNDRSYPRPGDPPEANRS